MSTYAIIDSSTNVCDNMCVWDGVTPWEPPPNHYIVLNDDGAGNIGDFYDQTTGTWTPQSTPA
jgi:hypothetical protein